MTHVILSGPICESHSPATLSIFSSSRRATCVCNPDKPSGRVAIDSGCRAGNAEVIRRSRARSQPGNRWKSRRQRIDDVACHTAREAAGPCGIRRNVYASPLANKVEVRNEGGKLVAGNATARVNSALSGFYGPDMAYVTAGPGYVGTPYEFIRTPAGKVGWIRNNGRVARKEGVQKCF